MQCVIAVTAVALATAWLALLVAAPVLPGWAGGILYGVGSLICHQIPERSFHLGVFQLPVCARCLGIYAGAAVGAVFSLLRLRPRVHAVLMAPAAMRRLAVVAAAPTLLTVVLEAAGVWHPSNVARSAAGAPLGGMVAFMVMRALATLHYGECAPPRPTEVKPPQ